MQKVLQSLAFPIFFLIVFPLSAQEDFEQLSAKDRIDIAEREKQEAKTDAEFQQLMSQGHQLFENRHYLKAIHKYEEAQERRPYNVYPKVIIADIELSMKDTLKVLREAERQAERKQPPKDKPEITKEPKEKPQLTETKEETIERLSRWEADVRRDRERAREQQETEPATPVESTEGDVKQMSVEEYQRELAQMYPKGITENVTREGNKQITTRIVVNGDKGNEYKKVEHDWGGVFYFKNGDAVTERVWKQETEN